MASNEPNKYQVVLTKQAKKFLSTIPKNYYRIISQHLLNLEHDPFRHGSISYRELKTNTGFVWVFIEFYILLNTIIYL